MPLMNVDAKNGLETYEELLERCKNFEPNDIWVVTMDVYTRDLGERLYIDKWILGYSKKREIAIGYAFYMQEAMTKKPYGYSAKGIFRFLCDRGLIPDEAKENQDYMYRIQEVDFRAERVREIGIPEEVKS